MCARADRPPRDATKSQGRARSVPRNSELGRHAWESVAAVNRRVSTASSIRVLALALRVSLLASRCEHRRRVRRYVSTCARVPESAQTMRGSARRAIRSHLASRTSCPSRPGEDVDGLVARIVSTRRRSARRLRAVAMTRLPDTSIARCACGDTSEALTTGSSTHAAQRRDELLERRLLRPVDQFTCHAGWSWRRSQRLVEPLATGSAVGLGSLARHIDAPARRSDAP